MYALWRQVSISSFLNATWSIPYIHKYKRSFFQLPSSTAALLFRVWPSSSGFSVLTVKYYIERLKRVGSRLVKRNDPHVFPSLPLALVSLFLVSLENRFLSGEVPKKRMDRDLDKFWNYPKVISINANFKQKNNPSWISAKFSVGHNPMYITDVLPNWSSWLLWIFVPFPLFFHSL